MSEAQKQATELRDFNIEVDWHELKRPERYKIIARDVEDAKEVALRFFRQARTDAAVIEGVREVKP